MMGVSTVQRWWPVLTRGFIWVAMAMLKCYIDAMHNVTIEKVRAYSWVEWSVLAASVGLEGFLALRLYLDQSLGQHKAKIANEDDPTNPQRVPSV